MDRIAPESTVIIVNLQNRDQDPEKDYIFRHGGGATFNFYRFDPPHLEPFSTNPALETTLPMGKVEPIGRVVRVVIDL